MKKVINSSEVWNFGDPHPSTATSSKMARWGGGEKALICLSMEVQLSASHNPPVTQQYSFLLDQPKSMKFTKAKSKEIANERT